MANYDPSKAAQDQIGQAVQTFGSEQLKDIVAAGGGLKSISAFKPLLEYETHKQELAGLIAKIVAQWLKQRELSNPLSVLKRGTEQPLGYTIEDIHVNRAEEKTLDLSGSTLLTPVTNDVKTAYYNRNRTSVYEAMIYESEFKEAFTAWETLNSYMQRVIRTLYDGNEVDEMTYSKQLFGHSFVNNLILKLPVKLPINDATSAEFMKKTKTAAINMTMPSTKFNAYSTLPGAVGNPIVTQCPIDEMIMILRTDVYVNLGVDLLARMFNLSYAEFMTKVLVVDNFVDKDGKEIPDLYGFMGDSNLPIIATHHRNVSSFYNAANESFKYFLHLRQTWNVSPMVNGLLLVKEA